MRLRQFSLFISIILIFVVACQKVDIQYGAQNIENQATQINMIDTFCVDLSTVFVDSFPTSASGVTLLGGYTDTSFGRVDTKCFFELNPPFYEKIYDSTRFDSLNLIIRLNHNFYGDTTKPLHLDVSRLSQQIILPQYTSSFYNNQSFSAFSAKLGSGDFLINPSFYTDTISIKLNDVLGREFLAKLKDASDLDLQSSTAFLNYFNGLCISSNAAASMVLGCKDDIVMRLSYSKPGPDTLEKHRIDFSLDNKQHHFNNITVDRSALKTQLKNINHFNNVIPSSMLGNTAYSQYASGVMAKITFPSIKEILKRPNFVKVLSAQLKLVPVKGTFDNNYFLPPSLELANTDLANGIGSALISSGYNPTTMTGNLFLDKTFNDNTIYTYDLSNYIKLSLQNPQADKFGLLLLPPSPATTTQFTRVILGNSSLKVANKNATKLEIYYLTVQPQ